MCVILIPFDMNYWREYHNKEVCKVTGNRDHKTNQCLCAATELYLAGGSKKITQEQASQCSIEDQRY